MYYVKERDIRIRLFGLILPVVRENLFNRDLSFGSNSQWRGQFNRTSDLSLELIGTIGMALVEIAGLTDLE